jgi:hypothetical protein
LRFSFLNSILFVFWPGCFTFDPTAVVPFIKRLGQQS